MKANFVLALMTAFPAVSHSPQVIENYILWNVGQGQWLTWERTGECHHFDMGGEFHLAQMKLEQACGAKRNYLYLTHADWDHISFIAKQSLRLSALCLKIRPNLPLRTRQRKILQIPECTVSSKLPITIHNQGSRLESPNDRGFVYLVNSELLILGDTSVKSEADWLTHANLKSVRFLIVGHHGSRTSTSAKLLSQLPNLRMALASARYRRYRHPHPSLRLRLQKHAMPLIITESFGNIMLRRL